MKIYISFQYIFLIIKLLSLFNNRFVISASEVLDNIKTNTNNLNESTTSSTTSIPQTQTTSIITTLSLNNNKNNNKDNQPIDKNNVFYANEKETITLKCPIEFNKQPALSPGLSEETNKLAISLLNNKPIDNENNGMDGSSTVVDSNDDLLDSNEADEDKTDDEYDLDNDLKRLKREGSNFLIVQWFKDSTKINKFKTLGKFKQDGINLKIKNVNLNDAGKYKCKLINGFGSVSSTINLIVPSSQVDDKLKPDTSKEISFNTKEEKSSLAPVFTNTDKLQSFYYKKAKGSQVKFRCNAKGFPKPDILWYKDGFILSEEDYGITRSKWSIELKDLRLGDTGNYTCKVFNKVGFINATFELNIYDDSQPIETIKTPANLTILAGMDAILTCKVRSFTRQNLKWMKQITRDEYRNYVIQNNPTQALDSAFKLPTPNKKLDINSLNSLHQDTLSPASSFNLDDESIKSFYLMSTLSPLSSIESLDKSSHQTGDEEISLSDLIGQNESLEHGDQSQESDESNNNFDLGLFVSNDNEKLRKEKNFKKKTKLINENNYNNPNLNQDESIHYITLSSSPLVIEKQTYSKELNVYTSQLMIKQAELKDTGIYVCFGSNSKILRKSYLKVLPKISSDLNSKQFLFGQNDNTYETWLKFKELHNKQKQQQSNNKAPTESTATSHSIVSFLNNSIQSYGILIILVPVLIICSLAIISICYLKRLDEQKKSTGAKKMNNNCCFFGIDVLFRSCFQQNSDKSSSQKSSDQHETITCCCCFRIPAYSAHVLMQENFDETEALSKEKMFIKQQKRGLPCTTSSSLGSSLSDSTSSTAATTLAYYVTIPMTKSENTTVINTNSLSLPSSTSSPPPPLPNTQPPVFKNNSNNSPNTIVLSCNKNRNYLNDSQLKCMDFAPNNNSNANKESMNSTMLNENESELVPLQANKLERTVSTPSMAYYKIVDCDLIDWNSIKSKNSATEANADINADVISTSTNSRLYYQLTPAKTSTLNNKTNNINSSSNNNDNDK